MTGETAGPVSGQGLAEAAEALVGAPFRLHGREPELGLDCVGLLAAAMERAGCERYAIAPDYALRNKDVRWAEGLALKLGFDVAEGPLEPGDVILFQVGACQHHLVLAARDGGFIHAHAGLRRVVRSPSLPDWVPQRRWRLVQGAHAGTTD